MGHHVLYLRRSIDGTVYEQRVLVGKPAQRTQTEIGEPDIDGRGRRGRLTTDGQGIVAVVDDEIMDVYTGRIILQIIIPAHLPGIIIQQQAVRIEDEFQSAWQL